MLSCHETGDDALVTRGVSLVVTRGSKMPLAAGRQSPSRVVAAKQGRAAELGTRQSLGRSVVALWSLYVLMSPNKHFIFHSQPSSIQIFSKFYGEKS